MILPGMLVLFAIFASSSSESSGPFPVAAISEVEIKGGSARATSHHSADWTPDKAFILGHKYGWHIAPQAYGRFPAMIWYEFPAGKTFVPGRISFRPRKDCCENGIQGPTVWQFVGSNDESCGSFGLWTVLCEDRSDKGYRHKFTTKYCDVDDQILREFKCLGIIVLNTHEKIGRASLKDVRMWKKVYQ